MGRDEPAIRAPQHRGGGESDDRQRRHFGRANVDERGSGVRQRHAFRAQEGDARRIAAEPRRRRHVADEDAGEVDECGAPQRDAGAERHDHRPPARAGHDQASQVQRCGQQHQPRTRVRERAADAAEQVHGSASYLSRISAISFQLTAKS